MNKTESLSPFDYVGQHVQDVAMISVQFPDGFCIFELPGVHGHIEVQIGDFTFNTRSGERLYYRFEGNRYLGAQEGANWTPQQRQVSPESRMFSSYIGFMFESLAVLPTSDGSRFLSVNETYAHWKQNSSASIDDTEGRKHLLVANEPDTIANAISALLPLIGVPEPDIPRIVSEILSKVITS